MIIRNQEIRQRGQGACHFFFFFFFLISVDNTVEIKDRSAMSGGKTLSPPGPMSYLRSLALRIWTSF